jgi:hypothetical protein
MNELSFHLNLDEEDCLYVDGKPCPGSAWLDWEQLVRSATEDGQEGIPGWGCSCPECDGVEDYSTFSGDGFVAWRTHDFWGGQVFLFDKRHFLETVHDAIEELEWYYGLRCRGDYCPCAISRSGPYLGEARLAAQAALDALDKPVPDPRGAVYDLLNAICLSNMENVCRLVAQGAYPSHLQSIRWKRHCADKSILLFVCTFAPAPVRLPMLKLLAEKVPGAWESMNRDEEIMYDIVSTQDAGIVEYLLPHLWNTEDNRWSLEGAICGEFAMYTRDFCRCARAADPRVSLVPHNVYREHPTWQRLAEYNWHATRLNLPRPDYLIRAKTILDHFEAQARTASWT